MTSFRGGGTVDYAREVPILAYISYDSQWKCKTNCLENC